MKALSVRQPWAELIASGRKIVEVRTWKTNYRGPLLICAGARRDDRGPIDIIGPLGVAVAVVELIDVRENDGTMDDAACWHIPDGAYCWMLSSPRRVSFPVLGRLGLFEVTLDTEQSLSVVSV